MSENMYFSRLPVLSRLPNRQELRSGYSTNGALCLSAANQAMGKTPPVVKDPKVRRK
jgi:hypothetical protein